MRRLGTALGVVLALLAPAQVARGAWVVDANGACVERWTSADLLRGPTAIVNAPLLPFRSLAGGAEYAWNTEEWWPYQIAVLGPAVTLVSAGFGAVESLWWVATGLADTLTGGALFLAPERATQLSIAPDVPSVIADRPEPPATTDRCGRPLPAATPAPQ
ncbi:MAG: hypothetical protein SF182_22085 [Deltaproteobacteria bacterium]|nr:hypothetical protein [Deltaproteobacteria bacterium]